MDPVDLLMLVVGPLRPIEVVAVIEPHLLLLVLLLLLLLLFSR